ncbi:hypothetical protein NDU88_002802 [Pleurodeles waltl]|uniref:Uncharacterized protein n=1 Tax=Pleurodeles waltl TaxID=8319 RepID=A0AAV7MNQ4_PLEWA|nr:hypothetical protein NDU88_002802 [Pleurodeles waltl]
MEHLLSPFNKAQEQVDSPGVSAIVSDTFFRDAAYTTIRKHGVGFFHSIKVPSAGLVEVFTVSSVLESGRRLQRKEAPVHRLWLTHESPRSRLAHTLRASGDVRFARLLSRLLRGRRFPAEASWLSSTSFRRPMQAFRCHGNR